MMVLVFFNLKILFNQVLLTGKSMFFFISFPFLHFYFFLEPKFQLLVFLCLFRVNKNPTSKFKKVENCNYAVNIGKEIGLSLVNIGGVDIVDRAKKLILAIIWQLMRK